MGEITTKYGKNAGQIWKLLNKKGALDKQKIIENASINEHDFHVSVGWLARENKINKNEDKYQLDRTNLTEEIGSNAGKIWKILDIWGEADLSMMKRLADINEQELYQALGWLAREDKIQKDLKNQRYYLK